MKQLQKNPLRTKMITSGSLSGLQELLASWIAHDRSYHGHYFTARVPKMALYGAIISAPLGHFLITILQKVFRGRTGLKAKILQIMISNLIVGQPPISKHKIQKKGHITNPNLSPFLSSYFPGFTNPKFHLSRLHGHHFRRKNLPPGPRHRSCRLHARHEGLVDHFPRCPCFRAAISARAGLGSVFQHHRFRDWHVH